MAFEAAATPNGTLPQSEDLVDTTVAGTRPEENGHGTTEAAPEAAPRGLYFVRIPKPPMDDTQLKRLQLEFQSHVTKLKGINAKLSAKRDEVRGFKAQMNEARGLKETSEPEFQDKYSRIVELRNLRSSYVTRMKTIRESLSSFDCKSEAELDEKIRSIEHKITHEGVSLREEKQLVQQVSKLTAMRPKMKEYEPLKTELTELETEANKIKAIIDSMDGEFSVIKNERDATKKVVQDIYGNLKKAQEELQVLEAEQADVVGAKESALKALDGTRDETNANMRDFRENRKFSLTVRDLVAAGETEQATALVHQQVDEWVAKLSSDASYRKEYQTLWAAQRKAPISDLLPQSCTNAPDPTPNKVGSAAAGGRAPPPGPRGAEKAKALIEQLMQEASKEAAEARARTAVQNGSDADADDDEDDKPQAAAEAKKPEASKPLGAALTGGTGLATKPVKDPAAAAAAAFNFKVSIPRVEDEGFELPLIKSDITQQSKEQIREEQQRKNQEAEERKRKRAETAERKRQQAAETARRLEAERKERDATARAAAFQSKVATVDEPPAAEEVAAAMAAPTAQQQQVTKISAPTPFEKRQAVAAAKRVKAKNTLVKQVHSSWTQYQGWIILAVVVIICLMLSILYLATR